MFIIRVNLGVCGMLIAATLSFRVTRIGVGRDLFKGTSLAFGSIVFT